MIFESEEFVMLHREAHALLEAGRFDDAVLLFERVLQATCIPEQTRLDAQFWLGQSLLYSGQYNEAFVNLGMVYSATKLRPETHYSAHRAFYLQVETVRLLQVAEESETKENLAKRLDLIGEGLRWLRDIGREEWRDALLLERADALYHLGQTEEALFAAEEAYRVAKEGGSGGFRLAEYAVQVAACARKLALFVRGFRVLDEMEGRHEHPLMRLRLLKERVQLLRETDPPRLGEAIEVARRMVQLASEVTYSLDIMRASEQLVYSAIMLDSFDEASAALTTVRHVALESEDTQLRATLLHEAADCFRKTDNLLVEKNGRTANALHEKVVIWANEIQHAQEVSKKHRF